MAQQARRSYTEGLLNGLRSVVQAVDNGARILVSQVAEPSVVFKRRDLIPDLQKGSALWLHGMTSMLRAGLASGMVSASRPVCQFMTFSRGPFDTRMFWGARARWTSWRAWA